MSGIHIGHDVQMKDNCTMETGSALGGHVIVGNNVYFSKLSAIHQFVELGDFSSLGKDAAVTQDIPPYCIAKGNRAKITGPNLKTLVEKFSQNEVDDIIDAFGILSNESRSPKESASAALTESNSELVKNLYSFIIKSKRGIPFRRKVNVN
jgi:UDP-N-acetylglucosamine acyltransferase